MAPQHDKNALPDETREDLDYREFGGESIGDEEEAEAEL